jgi:ComF family protein
VLFDWLGDLLSPPRCAACSAAVARGRGAFCVPCAASVEMLEGAGDPSAFGEYGGALARAIQRLKYEDQPELATSLGALVRHACRPARVRADLVVPVPLHRRRLAQRGYNQSALLAHHVGRELRAPVVTGALVRAIDTLPQVELPREARRENVRGAFRVVRGGRFAGKTIALVDDVSTTGATLAACSAALIEAGARQVTRVVLARTVATTDPAR